MLRFPVIGTSLLVVLFAATTVSADTPGAMAGEACVVEPGAVAEFARLPKSAAIEDFEGATLFAVSQLQCSGEAVVVSLEAMTSSTSLTLIQRQAVGNIAAALRRRGMELGTGQVLDNFATSEFGVPLSGGASGAGANYSAQ